MKNWLKQVIEFKNIDPTEYLKELEVNEEFKAIVSNIYNNLDNVGDDSMITMVIIKSGDRRKIISFHKGDIGKSKIQIKNVDHGVHYRFEYITPLGEVVKVDPYFVGKVWGMSSAPLQTVLKKIARSGSGGYKDYEQDIKDCICALERELELIS